MDMKPLKLTLAVSILALCGGVAHAQDTATAPGAETVPEPTPTEPAGPSRTTKAGER